jgi:glucose/arabinose dehydrogenase
MVINRINFLDGKSEIFSTGHRNPQGLYVSKNIILSTEHGPRGGDEINRIFKGKNYGWPVASYGETYNENYSNKDQFNYKKNHYNLGFEEPLFAFTPSIGITQILPVNIKFSERWENSFLIGSLRAQSLYRVVFDHNFTRVINFEKILISNRIRDINYSAEYNFFILALEDEDGSIGILQVDNN